MISEPDPVLIVFQGSEWDNEIPEKNGLRQSLIRV